MPEEKIPDTILRKASVNESEDLNDDLQNVSDDSESSDTFSNIQSANMPYSNSVHNAIPSGKHRRTGSAMSFRNSIDNESVFSSTVYYNILNSQSVNPDDSLNTIQGEYSPLGPNSIYELTIGSDTARARRKKAPKSSVTINGGLTTVANLKFPTTRDIPQIQLVKLKSRVKDSDLQAKYVANLEDEYKSFESSYRQLTQDTLFKFTQQEQGKVSASSSVANFQDVEFGSDELSAIPKVYLEEEFRLDDPRVFKQVIEGASIIPSDNDDPSSHLVNNTALQERISHYLDIVEVSLIKEISKTSDSFFSTIGDIEKIQTHSNECVDKFQSIKEKLEQVENGHSRKGLQIFDKLVQKKNVEHLESCLLQLKYVVSTFDLANKSFTNSQYSKCLTETILTECLVEGLNKNQIEDESLRALYPSFQFPLVDLTGLPALIHLRNDLQTLKDECSKGYINDFIQVLLDDLRTHCRSVPVQDTLNRLYNGIDKTKKYHSKPVNNSYLVITDSKRQQLMDYVRNLAKSGRMVQAYSSYQDRIMTEIKDIIKTNLPTQSQNGSTDMSNTPSRSASVPPESLNSNPSAISQSQTGESLQVPHSTNTSLSSNIKSLTPKEFEQMFIKTYADLSECLRRLTAHQKLLLDLALTTTTSLAPDFDIMSLDISIAISKAIELTQVRLTRVINVRSEQTADLTVPFYLRLNSITSAYLQECELISPGFNGSALSEWFRNHLNYFVHRFHHNALKALVTDTNRDTWKEVTSAEALSEAQEIVDEITGYTDYILLNGNTGFSGEKWLEPLDFHEKPEVHQDTKVVENDKIRVTIGSESFMIPSLALRSVRQIRDYLIIAKVFTSTASSIENNLLNYFKLLNSKTYQAVLNAGATRTAGLKHIFPKHIALCIQLVEFNLSLLDRLKTVFPSRESTPVPVSGSPSEDLSFARIISNYKDHENELFSKLVSILHDRTVTHSATIKNINWSEPLKHPQQCHQYMETLVKDTLTVTKAISRYLPELKCSLILSQIFDNYKRILVECYCTQLPQFKDFNEKHMVLKDIDYFRVKLCELPGYGNSGQVIWENVNSLPTVEDTKMEEVMRHNIADERLQISSVRGSAKSSLEVQRSSEEKQRKTEVQPITENLPGQELLVSAIEPEEEKELPISEKEAVPKNEIAEKEDSEIDTEILEKAAVTAPEIAVDEEEPEKDEVIDKQLPVIDENDAKPGDGALLPEKEAPQSDPDDIVNGPVQDKEEPAKGDSVQIDEDVKLASEVENPTGGVAEEPLKEYSEEVTNLTSKDETEVKDDPSSKIEVQITSSEEDIEAGIDSSNGIEENTVVSESVPEVEQNDEEDSEEVLFDQEAETASATNEDNEGNQK
ncbi:hypothetical protein G9P44_000406 [Scheffersomyces stipitis]|nr:hypothetical protein G9P44_000406 [Scheffersomyces stipitis]